MKIVNIKVFGLLLLSGASFSVSADYTVEDMYQRCGLGGAIFKDNPTFAVISNVTWDSGSTAISSGLSKSGCNDSSAEAAALIIQKQDSLEAEVASGEGVHLTALMDIYGCSADSRAAVVSGFRSQFGSMIESRSSNEISDLNDSIEFLKGWEQSINNSCVI